MGYTYGLPLVANTTLGVTEAIAFAERLDLTGPFLLQTSAAVTLILITITLVKTADRWL
jgi:hypothetical protein